jgi:hypothetical protein
MRSTSCGLQRVWTRIHELVLQAGEGSYTKNPTGCTSREFRKESALDIASWWRGKSFSHSYSKEKNLTLFLTPFKPNHSSLEQWET